MIKRKRERNKGRERAAWNGKWNICIKYNFFYQKQIHTYKWKTLSGLRDLVSFFIEKAFGDELRYLHIQPQYYAQSIDKVLNSIIMLIFAIMIKTVHYWAGIGHLFDYFLCNIVMNGCCEYNPSIIEMKIEPGVREIKSETLIKDVKVYVNHPIYVEGWPFSLSISVVLP